MVMTAVSYQVCEEDWRQCCAEAQQLLIATRHKQFNAERLPWLYGENPDGPAIVWTVRQPRTGDLIAFTAALPRRMLVNGQPRTCWNGADFSVHPRFCTLGIALKLRRAARLGIDEGRADFLYSHPNATMQLIHEKVGHVAIGSMIRYAKPLQVSPYLRRSKLGHWIPRPIFEVADDFFAYCDRRAARQQTLHLYLQHQPKFDDRFDTFFSEYAATRPVIGVRDAAYLHWRYAVNPLERVKLLTALDGNRLVGYAVFTGDNSDTFHIKDLCALPGTPAADELLARLARIGRANGQQAISAVVLAGHPLEGLLAEHGFRRRPDASQMYGYARAEDDWSASVLAAKHWLIAAGDRDV